EVFVEAETKGLEIVWCRPVVEFIVPAIHDGLAFCNIAHRRLPAITVDQAAALHDAPSGKAKKSRVHVSEELNEIFAKAVGTVLPCIDGKQRHHIEIDVAFLVKKEIELSLIDCRIGADNRFEPLPVAVEAGQSAAAQFALRSIGDRCADRLDRGAAHIGGEAVLRSVLYTDSAKTRVPHPKTWFVSAHSEIVRIRGV